MAIINVYHGSLEVVTQPEIREPYRRLDYGTGFYTTTAYWQADHNLDASGIRGSVRLRICKRL